MQKMSTEADSLDNLVDVALMTAMVEGGYDMCKMAAGKAPVVVALAHPTCKCKPPAWSDEEDELLRSQRGYMTDRQIGELIGRSEMAVHLRGDRLFLPRPLKDPAFVTTNWAALLLGIDAHKACSYVDRGLIQGEKVASDSNRTYRRIKKTVLLRWMFDPDNWIWFNPEKVSDPHLRRLLLRKKAIWNDEWWNTRQIADHYGCSTKEIVTGMIKRGIFKTAVRAVNAGGRHNAARWSFWYVRRSEVLQVRYPEKTRMD